MCVPSMGSCNKPCRKLWRLEGLQSQVVLTPSSNEPGATTVTMVKSGCQLDNCGQPSGWWLAAECTALHCT